MGKKKAIIAVARKIVALIYKLLHSGEVLRLNNCLKSILIATTT
ncbi:hypothetical protein [Sporomusa sp. KB1]|nr:hypothetical protein [Sporomusa sp. KB1]